VTFVLDAWAVMAVFNREPPALRISKAIATGEGLISWINLGEAYYLSIQRRDRSAADDALRSIRDRVRTVLPDVELVLAAARIKARARLSYADAFCVATAQRHKAPLWTGDPEIIALADEVEIVDLR
jgi:predicted nucleic acid-binding protein